MMKDWSKFYKQHKYVPANKIDGLNSFSEGTKAFRISIN